MWSGKGYVCYRRRPRRTTYGIVGDVWYCMGAKNGYVCNYTELKGTMYDIVGGEDVPYSGYGRYSSGLERTMYANVGG